jgi:N-methylhydantoinase B
MLDPITAEIIVSGLAYASEEMGIAVRNAAYSPNIKERLDHSCALFDRELRMIAQAEHIPVHLGSLPWGMRQTLKHIAGDGEVMRPGDQWVVNDPYLSGTHLNDVTVIRPIFIAGEPGAPPELFAYAANKAHHTDVGGMVPGSMPPDARELFAEGFVMPPMRLMRDDRVAPETVALFRANSRTPESRSGDLRAQLAGNHTGERRVRELVERYGATTFAAATAKALGDGEQRMRAALRAFPDGVAEVTDVMEDANGAPSIVLKLRLEVRGDRILLDYTGTAPQQPLPLNAVYGVTLSGVYYALRAVLGADIPMNDGVFRPVEVHVPEGSLLNPHRPAAVSAGNVETSMRNADLVLAALAVLAPDRIPAQSGGSMNNVMMGGIDEHGAPWAFYETNGCGMGARPGADGIDAIQAHMTNTRNTPIEVLERTFPLRVVRYEFAERTAGAGRFRGGSGLIRALQVRGGSATVSLLGERHAVRPHGTAGGHDGAAARHAVLTHPTHGQAELRELPAKVTIQLEPGQTLVVQTAGGGGYGEPAQRDPADLARDTAGGIETAR